MVRGRSALVPGHQAWRAKKVRRGGRTIAIRARHRLLRWWTITVKTTDLRYGVEAVARYLDGAHAGIPLHDSRASFPVERALERRAHARSSAQAN